MRFCSECGKQLPDDAKFCSGCGKATDAQENTPAARPCVPATNQDWYTLTGITSQPTRLLGIAGSVLAFISAFCPWGEVAVTMPSFDGFNMPGMPGMHGVTAAAHTELGWLIVLLSIVALVAIFKRGAGVVVALAGAVIAAYALVSLVVLLGDNNSPSYGIAFSLIGGALMIYSGFRALRLDKA